MKEARNVNKSGGKFASGRIAIPWHDVVQLLVFGFRPIWPVFPRNLFYPSRSSPSACAANLTKKAYPYFAPIPSALGDCPMLFFVDPSPFEKKGGSEGLLWILCLNRP